MSDSHELLSRGLFDWRKMMKQHIKSGLVFWTLSAIVVVELAVVASRLYISPLNFWKLFFGTIVFYNVIGLIVSLLSVAVDRLLPRRKSGSEKKFRPWVFGGIHGGIAIYMSLFYWLNKVVQTDTYVLSLAGLSANIGIALGGFIIGVIVIGILYRLPGFLRKWILLATLVVFAIVNYSMFLKVEAFQNKIVESKEKDRKATGLKVLIIGVDGATWDVLDPLVDSGEVPNFAKLVNEGFSDRFRTIMPTSSPIIWTTIATGKNASKHGVSNVVFTVIPGMSNSVIHFSNLLGAKLFSDFFMQKGIFYSVPVSSTIRHSKALWNITSDYGITTDVIGWWGTWPPDSVKGCIVSDLTSSYKKEVRETKGQLTARGEYGVDQNARTFPASLEMDLMPIEQKCMSLSLEEANRFFETDSSLLEKINTAKKWKRFDYPVAIRYGYLIDKFNSLVGQYLMEKENWECFMLYLNMIDIMEHYFWMYYDEEPFKNHKIYGDLPFKDVVPNTYKIVDSMIGQILERADDNTIIIIVSDHGFETFYSKIVGPVCNHTRAPDGILIAAGPYIAHKKQRTRQYSVHDVTPTVLTLLGVPLGEDMDGRVMEDILIPGFLEDYPVEYVDSHDAGYKWRSRSTQSEADTHMLEKFRALGYIQ